MFLFFVNPIISNPRFSILFFIISPLIPNLFSQFNIPTLNIINLAFICCITSLIIYKVKSNYQLFKIPKDYLYIFFILNLFLFLGSFYFNEQVYSGIFQSIISNYFKQIIIISIYIFAYNYSKNFDISFLYKVLSYFILFIIISFFIDKIVYGLENKELAGFFGTGNTVGNYLVAVLPLTIYIKKYYSINSIIQFLPFLCIVVILMSNSRGSILALTIISFLYFIIFLEVSQITKLVYLFMTFIIVMFLVIQSGYYYDIVAYFDNAPILSYEYWNDTELLIDSSGRSTIWSNLFLFISDNNYFLFGSGVDNFLKVSDYNTQNHFLKIIADYGILFAFLLLLIYLYIIFGLLQTKSLINNNKFNDFIKLYLLSIVSLSIIGLFSHYNIGSSIMSIYWMQFGLFIFYKNREKTI